VAAAASRIKAHSSSAVRGLITTALLVFLSLRAFAQGTAPTVTDIKIVGNQRVETDAIRVHISQPVGQPEDPSDIDADIKSIYKMGFFDSVRAGINSSGVLTYYVHERPLLTDIRFVGLKAIKPSDDKIVNALAIHSGAIYDPVRAKTTIRNIEEVYQNKGYLDVRVAFRLIPHANNTAIGLVEVTEGPQVKIGRVEFSGNKSFSARKLRGVIETQRHTLLSYVMSTGYLDQKKLQSDVDRLQTFYYQHGYVNAVVSQPTIVRHGDALTITFPIDEGPQYHVGTVNVAGDILFPAAELEKDLTLKPKTVFSGTDMQHDVLTLSDFYSDRGYAYVNVDPRTQVNPTTQTVDVTYNISPGQEVLVDRIRITGNTKTSDKVIRRELTIQEQEPYSSSKIQRSKQKLDALGYFSNTRISTEPGPSPDKINLDIAVQEKNTASLQVGGGYDSYSSVFGNFSITNTNLFGGGEAVSVSAQLGYLYQDYNFNYVEPWFLDMPLKVSLSGFYDKLYLYSFDQSNLGFSLTASYPLSELGVRRIRNFSLEDIDLSLGYEFQRIGISIPSGQFATFAISQYEGYHSVSEITPSIRRFTVDNPFDPRTGSIQSLDMEVSGLGGGTSFLKGVFHMRYFFPFIRSPEWGEWVFSPSFTYGAGTLLSSGQGSELPLYERFFPGGNQGSSSVRGYELYSLGPQVALFSQTGQPFAVEQIGGSYEMISSGEVTFPILSSLGIRGATFIDAGQAYLWHTPPSLSTDNLQAASGFGVRWKSPFGPLAIDLAFPLNKRPNDESVVFDFGAGTPL